MPAQKITDPNSALSGIMDFSRMKTHVYNPDKKVTNAEEGRFDVVMKDCTPSQPPWTSFTGILEARRDSVIGKRILAMDPKATDGKHKHHTASEWVRGIWTAPTNWSEIPSY
jgi:hypothetical protein